MNILTTDDRPQGPFAHFAKKSNGHNSATRQPIPFMFGYRVGLSGTADRTAPFPVGSNPRWRPAAILENFKWPNLLSASSNLLYLCIQIILCLRPLSIMTEIRNFVHKGGSPADLRYKEKERKSRSWQIVEKITREEYIHYIDHNLKYFFFIHRCSFMLL